VRIASCGRGSEPAARAATAGSDLPFQQPLPHAALGGSVGFEPAYASRKRRRFHRNKAAAPIENNANVDGAGVAGTNGSA